MADSSASQPPPHTLEQSWSALCNKIDDEMDVPEVVYRFSNGEEKKSTDRTTGGVYGLSYSFLANENGLVITNEGGIPIIVANG